MSINTTSLFRKENIKTPHKLWTLLSLHSPFYYSAPIYSKTLPKNCLSPHLFSSPNFLRKNFQTYKDVEVVIRIFVYLSPKFPNRWHFSCLLSPCPPTNRIFLKVGCLSGSLTGSLPVIKLLPLSSKPTICALPCDAGSEATSQLCQQLPTGLHQKEALEGAGRAGRRDGFFLQDAGSWECQAAVTARPSSSRPTCGSSRTSLALRTDTHRTNLIQSQKETPAPAGTPSSEVWVLSPRPLLQTQPGSTPSLEAWAAPPQGPFSKLTKA